MNTLKHAVPALLSAILFPASAQTLAQPATIGDCQAIQDRLARYACYDNWDAAFGTVRQSAPARAPAPREAPRAETQAAVPAAAPEDSVADFGRSQSNARVVEGEDGEVELIDTVASLEQLGPSLWKITLDGGQVWQQMLSKRYPLEAGDEVRIYSTRWGSSYRLSSERLGSYIQVARIDNGAEMSQAEPAPAPQQAPVRAQEDEGSSFLGRLFDRDADEEQQETAAAVQPAVATANNSATSLETFGRPQANARLAAGDDGELELVDAVSELEQLGPNLWLISLEGGQQWQQMLSKRYALEVGDEVRIYPTRWGGAFRLSAERLGGYIQVERVD